MIQLKKSVTTNTFAFYPDVTISGSVTDLRVSYVQDLDQSSGSFDSSISSKKNWIVGQASGSDLPTPSGQYTLTLRELIPGAALVWGTADLRWDAADTRWDEANAATTGQTLAIERAYIEGGNEVSFTTYNSPNESGTYTTYNS
jgi:hypothetical protein